MARGASEVLCEALGLSPGADVYESVAVTPAAREKRERLAKWLYLNFLSPNGPTDWDDLLHQQRNYWRKLADEALSVVK